MKTFHDCPPLILFSNRKNCFTMRNWQKGAASIDFNLSMMSSGGLPALSSTLSTHYPALLIQNVELGKSFG